MNLFKKYYKKDYLVDLYKRILEESDFNFDNNKILVQKLVESKFSPEQNSNYWAEPFISFLISYDFGVNSKYNKIILINSYPNYANAPESVFQTCLDSKAFFTFLESYYNDENSRKMPMVLDDSTYCYNILGLAKNTKSKEESFISIIFADPHIYKQSYFEGIYILKFSEDGNQIDEEESVNSKIYFNKKSWMLHYIVDLDYE